VAGIAAASAYPAAAMAVALLAGGRQPVRWRPQDLAPEALVLPALGSGLIAFVAAAAALAAPLLLVPRHARLGVAAAALAAALAFAPGVPQLLYDLTGLGRPVWRLMWAMPVAALVGVLATQPAAARRRGAVRLAPAVAVCALVALAGTPVWQGRNTGLAGHPAIKRDGAQLAVAERLSRAARSGDVLLAPAGLSSTLLLLDGGVVAVAPRLLYTRALPASARREERLLLHAFANAGLTPDLREDRVRAALRALGVDLACLRDRGGLVAAGAARDPRDAGAAGASGAARDTLAPATRGQRLLARAGFRPILRSRGYWCGSVRDGA
jgi:hypothetical protein